MRALGSERFAIALTLALVYLSLPPLAQLCAASEATILAVTATSATLRWTAPGDDGDLGRASQYDLRFSVYNVQGNDSLAWWTSSSTKICSGLPNPGVAGTRDSFVVVGLAPERTYYFVLRTADEVENWSFFSNIAVVTTPGIPDTNRQGDTTPPPPVAGLTATPSAGGIRLTWSPSGAPDVAGYVLYRKYQQLDYVQLTDGIIEVTTYLDKDVLSGESYGYNVTAVDYSGNESPLAQAVTAIALTPPPVATKLLAPFPDPCLTQAILRYEISDGRAQSTLKIFDINGRLVRDLGEANPEPGQYSIAWDLRASNGERVAAGIYFCVLSSKDATSARKVSVLR